MLAGVMTGRLSDLGVELHGDAVASVVVLFLRRQRAHEYCVTMRVVLRSVPSGATAFTSTV